MSVKAKGASHTLFNLLVNTINWLHHPIENPRLYLKNKDLANLDPKFQYEQSTFGDCPLKLLLKDSIEDLSHSFHHQWFLFPLSAGPWGYLGLSRPVWSPRIKREMEKKLHHYPQTKMFSNALLDVSISDWHHHALRDSIYTWIRSVYQNPLCSLWYYRQVSSL